MLIFVVLSQDFFDSRIMEAIQKQLTVFSTGCQIKYEVSGNDVTFQHAVSFLCVVLNLVCYGMPERKGI